MNRKHTFVLIKMLLLALLVSACGNKEEQLFLNNGNIWYQGEVKDGRPHGMGRNYSQTFYYEGDWKDGVPNGQGKIFNVGGQLVFEGEVQNPPEQLETILKGSQYIGYGYYIKSGQGKKYAALPNGATQSGGSLGYLTYEGPLNSGSPIGNGTTYHANGQVHYEGEFNDNGQKHGYGKAYDQNGTLLFEGQWEYGMAVKETNAANQTEPLLEQPTQSSTHHDVTEFAGDWKNAELDDHRILIEFDEDGQTGAITSGNSFFEFKVYNHEGNLLAITAKDGGEEAAITEFYLEYGKLLQTGEEGVTTYVRF